jgi:poly(hydroxyalkanoate) depolymerase family esterase
MRSLSDTLERLARLKSLGREQTDAASHLAALEGFGSNPGALAAKVYVPSLLPKHPALVVVLHGCTQTASGYDHGTGWSKLAERHGFVVLLPEQVRANNGNLCFNWFVPGDTRRGHGEAHSIRQMIDAVVSRHGIDTSRIYVSGLSAGGGMANVMLATYPEVFAGGAIIAGLPYGVAATVPEAFDRMRGQGLPAPSALQSRLKTASSHQGPWPTISVWHGTQDNTVAVANAAAIIDQWRAVHDVGAPPDLSETVDGQSRTVWKDARGRRAIEYYSIAGMGHGTPIDPRARRRERRALSTGCRHILDASFGKKLGPASRRRRAAAGEERRRQAGIRFLPKGKRAGRHPADHRECASHGWPDALTNCAGSRRAR